MRRLYYKLGKLFLDKDLTIHVKGDNPAYEILEHIKIPEHLTDVIIYEQTYEQSLTGLIFVGKDSKGRTQYFYGKLHVKKRNSNRDDIFIRVYRVINRINDFIDNNISLKKKSDDVSFQLAVFMLIETSFFIRMGKLKYLKENETVGLLTLKNKHIFLDDKKLFIRFTGKDKVKHEFIVHKSNRLYKCVIKLYNSEKQENFLFNKLNERRIYDLMKNFNIRLKDLRTYGVNYTFLYNFWNNIKSLTPLPTIKKLITISIKETAETVGHSPSISRNAYMAITVLDFLIQDSEIITSIKDITFNEFVNIIIEYIENR
ncbi:DNA topoisomerase type I [Cotia virus SPAn232]|uniref:DNA topoisomerase n=3 Tax=Cotia virus TaxID=39444 RepID=H6TA67_9POXV|nr:DNA topoisomerase type I [Cotia virus SPAn232]ADT91107.1 DNA topoisomerase type I [Cotia virus SPAn232]AIT70708.1 DNA topoisomerase type I [Cotia virus]